LLWRGKPRLKDTTHELSVAATPRRHRCPSSSRFCIALPPGGLGPSEGQGCRRGFPRTIGPRLCARTFVSVTTSFLTSWRMDRVTTATEKDESLALTSSQQIQALQHLSQQAAGWLAGVTARTLRDHADFPRDSRGHYDARQVVKWCAGEGRAARFDRRRRGTSTDHLRATDCRADRTRCALSAAITREIRRPRDSRVWQATATSMGGVLSEVPRRFRLRRAIGVGTSTMRRRGR
jgi:hypothetical protein